MTVGQGRATTSRRLALVGLWAIAVVVAVGLSSWAVGFASRRVSEPVPPSALLSDGTSQAGAATTEPTTPSPRESSPAAAPTDPPTVPPASSSATPGATGEGGPASQEASPSPATPAPPSDTRTATSVGGTASFRFVHDRVELLWATPAAGFEVDSASDGSHAEVRFRSDRHESRIRAEWVDDAPSTQVDERPDDDPDER